MFVDVPLIGDITSDLAAVSGQPSRMAITNDLPLCLAGALFLITGLFWMDDVIVLMKMKTGILRLMGSET